MCFRQIGKITRFLFLSCILIIISMFPIGAVETVEINNQKVEIGSTITFVSTLKCDTTISGLNVIVQYPSNSLELIKDSVNTPNLGMTIANTDKDGEIGFTSLDVQKGLDFKKDNLLISASFKVKDGAKDGKITMDIKEIIDMNTADIQPENYTSDCYVKAGEYEGNIIKPSSGNGDIEEISGAKEIPVKDNNNSNNNVIIIIIVLVVVIVFAVLIAIFGKKNKNKLKDNDNDSAVTAGNDFNDK